MIITIDGPSGSGKSTVAQLIAKKLKILHINSGKIYRLIAFDLLCKKKPLENLSDDSLRTMIADIHLRWTVKNRVIHWTIDRKEIDHLSLYKDETSSLASKIAVFPSVRDKVNRLQNAIAETTSIVVEGRDIGTHVFPHAEVKFYLIADPKVRAMRRYQELLSYDHQSEKLSYENILQDVLARDKRDVHREIAPLKRPLDAYEVDSSKLSKKAVVKEMLFIIRRVQRSYKKHPIWEKLIGKGHSGGTFFYRLSFLFSKVIFHLFYRIQVHGLENYPFDKPAIIAPNHLSFLDPPVVGLCCPRQVFFLAQDYLFRIPILGFCIRRLNALPVTGSAQDATVIKLIIRTLAQKKHVMIFPEGSRSYKDEISPLKKGIGLIATKVDCWIVPTLIKGSFEAWPRGSWLIRPFKRIHVCFGKPFYAADLIKTASSSHEAREKIMSRLYEELVHLHGQFHS